MAEKFEGQHYTDILEKTENNSIKSPRRFFFRLANLSALFCADAFAFATSYFLLRAYRPMPAFSLAFAGNIPSIRSSVDIFLISAVFFIFIRYLKDDYGRRHPFWDGARETTRTLVLVAAPDLVLCFVFGSRDLILSALLSWFFLFPAIPIYRQTMRSALSLIGLWQIPTVIIGTGGRGNDAYSTIANSLSLGFNIRYFVMAPSDEESSFGLSHLIPLSGPDGFDLDALLARIKETGCWQAVIAAQNFDNPYVGGLTQRLLGSGIAVAVIPHLRGLPLFGLSTSYLFGKDLLLLQLRNNLDRLPSRFGKRLVDILGAFISLAILFPVILAIMFAIKLDDAGPIFFVQKRVGRHGKEFGCLKFRTMCVNAEEVLADWKDGCPSLYSEYILSNFKLRNDPRTTRVGRFLRRLSLDELPQILNVILGEMSLVGPRPMLAREVKEYGPAFDIYCRVRPGITGLWQISGRSETTFADRVNFDEWYILNWSFWYDFIIILQTGRLVVSGKGAY